MVRLRLAGTNAGSGSSEEAKLLGPPGSDAEVQQIQKFVQDQPKVSAQIVKGWVAAE